MVEYFGARLRELREQAGLSRKELAEKAGLQSEAGIRNLEQGIRSPSWETVIALADALGCSTEAFREKPTAEAEQPRKPGRPRKQKTDDQVLDINPGPRTERAPGVPASQSGKRRMR